MDPIIVSANVIDVLIPYVKKGAEQLAQTVGVQAVEKIQGLLEILKKRLSGDKEAEDTLTHFEEKPDRHKEALKSILEETLAKDKEFAKELDERIQDIGPTLKLLQDINVVETNAKATVLDAKKIKKGKVEATQRVGINKGETTVVKVDEIG